MTTGLLGGSFNPAHGGHRSISQFAIRALNLDDFWWLVSPGNPLKAGAKDMAPMNVRMQSAQKMAKRSRIIPTVIESELGTRYTVDTLRRLVAKYPKRRFIWIMGADNLAQFHRWRQYRDIACLMPIAVIARPGYDTSVIAAPAMTWFRRYVRRQNQPHDWTNWSTPALVLLRFRLDARSASALRMADPTWFTAYPRHGTRDAVTHKILR